MEVKCYTTYSKTDLIDWLNKFSKKYNTSQMIVGMLQNHNGFYEVYYKEYDSNDLNL